jgi:hypothetical protein
MTIQSTLLFSALVALTAASIYAYVGWQLSQRIVASPQAKLAWGAFTVWWYGVAATTLIGGLLDLFGALGLTLLPLFVTATYINLLVICLALWGLLYYLIYLFTGRSQSLVPLAIFYVIFYTLIVYYITASVPEGILLERWDASVEYRARQTGPFFGLLIILLLLPQILGGFAYFTLYFQMNEATQKYRILLVSWSIIIWFLSPLLALVGGLAEQDWWQIASRLIGLAAALTILMAYQPPAWLKQRYGIISLQEETQKP